MYKKVDSLGIVIFKIIVFFHLLLLILPVPVPLSFFNIIIKSVTKVLREVSNIIYVESHVPDIESYIPDIVSCILAVIGIIVVSLMLCWLAKSIDKYFIFRNEHNLKKSGIISQSNQLINIIQKYNRGN